MSLNKITLSFHKSLLFIYFLISGIANTQSSKNNEQLDQQLYKLKERLEFAKAESNTQKIAKTYIELGNFFKAIELYAEALKNYQAYLDIQKTKDSCSVYVYNSLASIDLDLKKYIEAKKYSLISLDLSETISYEKGKAEANALLGSIAEKQSDYNSALKYQNISLAIFKKLNDSTGLATVNENIGSIYEDLEQYDLAYSYFKKAQEFAKHSNSDLQINIINNLGDANRKTKNYEKAIFYTEEALKLAQQTNNASQIESALKDLARTYADTGDFEKAYNYLNNQSVVNEEELKKNTTEMVSAMQVLYDVKEKEAEVELLNKENQINKVRQYVILIITGAIILALIVGFIYWKKRKKHENRILEYKQQLLQADLDKKVAKEIALNREIDIKVSSLTNYSLHIAHKNKKLSDISKTLSKLKNRNNELVSKKLKDIVKDIEADLENNNEWAELMSYFGQIHPNFFSTLKQIVNDKLSSSEMRLCMLLRLNLSSKEIADILHITPDSVRIARYRLRKKLPLESKDDLQDYLLNLQLD